MADWASLPSDLVRRVGDCLLATNDIDTFMITRAVCPVWRSAVARPSTLIAVTDPRFRPRQWVMLDEADKEDDDLDHARLFLNVSTGRFCRLRLPVLRHHILAGSSDGLLVLGERNPPHGARVLNPFTGDILRFAAPVPLENKLMTAVVGSSSDPTICFSFKQSSGRYGSADVYCADLTSQLCAVAGQTSGYDISRSSMVSCADHVYVADYYGPILKILGTAQRYYSDQVADYQDMIEQSVFLDHRYEFSLVDSDGELLVVRRGTHEALVEVYRVDTARKVLEPLKSIGSRAIFLGERCLSVDANKFPSIDGNCVYYAKRSVAGTIRCDWTIPGDIICRYDLNKRREERIPVAVLLPETTYSRRVLHPMCPFSFAQVLLTYCDVLPDVMNSKAAVCKTSY